jgi:hypothetical protein
MADPRWPALRQAMGLTDEEFKKGLNKNGDLVGTRTDFRAVAAKWNISQERKRVEYFDKAIAAPFRENWPSVRVGSYEDGFRSDTNPYGANCFRFTNMWGSNGAIESFESFYSSENLRFGQAANTPQGDVFTPKTSWEVLLATAQVARAGAQVSNRKQLHWLTGWDYYTTQTMLNVGPYYKELLIHVAMNNSDQLFFQTSSWSTKRGHETVDSILKEINNSDLFSYSDRHLITLENIDYLKDYLISGVEAADGKKVYRLSWKIGSLHELPNDLPFSIENKYSEDETGAWFIVNKK